MGELIPHTVDLTQTIKELRSIDSVINDSVQILLDDKNDKGNPFEFTDVSELQSEQFEPLDDTYESSDESDHEKHPLNYKPTAEKPSDQKKPKRSSLPAFDKKTLSLSNYNSFFFKDLKIWYGYSDNSTIFYGTRGLLSIIYGQRFRRTPVYIVSGLLKKLTNPSDKVLYYGVAPQTRCYGLVLSSTQSLCLIDRYIKKLRYQHIHEDLKVLKEKIQEVEKLPIPEKRHQDQDTSEAMTVRSKKQKTSTQYWFNNLGKSSTELAEEPSLEQLFPTAKLPIEVTDNKVEKEHVFKIGDIVNIDFRHIDGQIHLGKIISFTEPDNYNVKFAEMDLVYCTKKQRISPLSFLDDLTGSL